jgi:hypothetical protein
MDTDLTTVAGEISGSYLNSSVLQVTSALRKTAFSEAVGRLRYRGLARDHQWVTQSPLFALKLV